MLGASPFRALALALQTGYESNPLENLSLWNELFSLHQGKGRPPSLGNFLRNIFPL